jgi:hypothetical protein
MFDVHVTETQEDYRVAVNSALTLDDAHLVAVCANASARPVESDAPDLGEGEAARYRIDLPKEAWPWGRESLVEDISDRLLGMASHKFVWEVDGSPFPNRSSKVLWETMKRGTPGAKHELEKIRAEWTHDIRSDEELRARTVVTWVGEHEFENRLKDRVERRLLLTGWIDSFLTDGLEAARTYGVRNGLVKIPS